MKKQDRKKIAWYKKFLRATRHKTSTPNFITVKCRRPQRLQETIIRRCSTIWRMYNTQDVRNCHTNNDVRKARKGLNDRKVGNERNVHNVSKLVRIKVALIRVCVESWMKCYRSPSLMSINWTMHIGIAMITTFTPLSIMSLFLDVDRSLFFGDNSCANNPMSVIQSRLSVGWRQVMVSEHHC